MLEPFLALFLKSPCVFCSRPADSRFCQDCDRQLQEYRHDNPRLFRGGDLPVFIWGRYGGKLKRAMARVKYERDRETARIMGLWLAKSWLDSAPVNRKSLSVIPIPLHPEKLKERGFNQAEILARSFCRATGYTLIPHALARDINTPALFNLNPEQRRRTLRGAFSLDPNFRTRGPILLLDDICTTGTTLKEAARVLRDRGGEVIGAVCVASSRT